MSRDTDRPSEDHPRGVKRIRLMMGFLILLMILFVLVYLRYVIDMVPEYTVWTGMLIVGSIIGIGALSYAIGWLIDPYGGVR